MTFFQPLTMFKAGLFSKSLRRWNTLKSLTPRFKFCTSSSSTRRFGALSDVTFTDIYRAKGISRMRLLPRPGLQSFTPSLTSLTRFLRLRTISAVQSLLSWIYSTCRLCKCFAKLTRSASEQRANTGSWWDRVSSRESWEKVNVNESLRYAIG